MAKEITTTIVKEYGVNGDLIKQTETTVTKETQDTPRNSGTSLGKQWEYLKTPHTFYW